MGAMCPICSTSGVEPMLISENLSENTVFLTFYKCPVCGRFELKAYETSEELNCNRLASYMVYNNFPTEDPLEVRYHTVLGKDACDELKTNPDNGLPVHIDAQMVENWYPETFSERIDRILLYLDKRTQHMGETVFIEDAELTGVFFVDRWKGEKIFPLSSSMTLRNALNVQNEKRYMANYLQSQALVETQLNTNGSGRIRLLPNGYVRLDSLKRRSASGKKAFVAMQFSEATQPLREAIRKGISDAGYNAIFIDEVQHNNLITPEILKHIRDSKFVVADLTHQNNGAYFEEGYAMGIGKPVIQLCQKDTKLHFDIAQKNTIMWDTEGDIPHRLTNRIRATID